MFEFLNMVATKNIINKRFYKTGTLLQNAMAYKSATQQKLNHAQKPGTQKSFL